MLVPVLIGILIGQVKSDRVDPVMTVRPNGIELPQLPKGDDSGNPFTHGQGKFSKGDKLVTLVGTAKESTEDYPVGLLSNGNRVGLIPGPWLRQYQTDATKLADSPEMLAQRSKVIHVANGPASQENTVCHYLVQTMIQDQGNRGTCCIFGTLAAVESLTYKLNRSSTPLSVEYANELKNNLMIAHSDSDSSLPQSDAHYFENLPRISSAGLGCVGVMQMLQRYRTTYQFARPYLVSASDIPSSYPGLSGFRWDVSTSGTSRGVDSFNYDAEHNRIPNFLAFGIGGFLALPPSTYHDVSQLEQIVRDGWDVPFSMWLYNLPSGTSVDATDPVQFRHFAGGEPYAGHCMDIVGFDHNLRVFIVKNSWGYHPADPDLYQAQYRTLLERFPGYTLVSYDNVADFTEAGVVLSPVSDYKSVQKLLGKWKGTIGRTGTANKFRCELVWRRLPVSDEFLSGKLVKRVGDLFVWTDEFHEPDCFRVNGEPPTFNNISGSAKLYIDFSSRGTNFHDTNGTVFQGTFTSRSIDLIPQATFRGVGSQSYRGIYATELELLLDRTSP